ncbi:ABC transporter permease [Treponema ruminis]|uniref:Putative ABC transport system permease protein n=1 Tax=Treponema ruminis TaxID=744515 RepID=A0A7W8GBK1_9SPIR|nr:ABC transporter permease [Treponema ruminis]MBB5227453.1 putative ABC transport system permease protein [Treponema ruminis]QSI02557.1 ABC transporter permease [Treponema ruminis]
MIQGILIEGLIFGIMVLGVFMTFRVLNFCDMTVDGSFPLGACVLAACLTHGISPALALMIVFVAGILAGFCTTVIYTKLRIPDLLAGILMMTMLYSVNLRVMSNQANVSFLKIPTIFSSIKQFMKTTFPAVTPDWGIVIFLVIFVGILLVLLNLFFSTDFGLTMGALGSNPQMVISQGVDPRIVRGVGICFGDGLAALSGALFAMYSGFADVGSGSGVVVSGLASLMLGEFVIHSNKIGWQTFRVILGSIIYRALMFIARRYGYNIGMNANDLKLITGLMIILCLIISKQDVVGWFKAHLKRPEATNA